MNVRGHPAVIWLTGLYRRLRHPTTGNHESPRRNELVFSALWGDLSRYNAERSRGVKHKPGWVELMRRKQQLYDDLNTESYREAGYTPQHDGDGNVIAWAGFGPAPLLHWDEARVRELFPDAAHRAFDYAYHPPTDTVTYVDHYGYLTSDL